ncbi:helix-turn-helix domain-containing protein [Niallia sp. Krafla_26]|uniref:helix-turn-helix domain-containing protein n=1 Tax=Niallia sp. Krafla_26 TaxID=3064703 RepID=UPI003D18626E
MLLKRLYELRKSNHLNQGDVAKYLGVARNTYSGYEIGTREMDYDTLVKIADFYKVSLDYLFDRTDVPIHTESYAPDEIEFMIKALNLYKEVKNKYR